MSGIRPLRRDDLPAVAALFDENARDGGTRPPSPVVGHLARTLLDPPWFDRETPSLVYEDASGEVVGTLAVRALPMSLDGRPIRAVAPTNLMVHGPARGRGIARDLLRTALDGPQDLAVSDAWNVRSRAAWHAGGGGDLVHACFEWQRVLRPARAAVLSDRAARLPAAVRRAGAGLAPAADALAAGLPPLRRRMRPTAPDVAGDPLTGAGLARLIRADPSLRLRPDHAPDVLDGLFAELDADLIPGRSVRTRLCGRDGRPLGWYVVHLTPGGTAQVLSLRATGPDPGPVLDHLFATAAAHGATVVRGRVQPDLTAALRSRSTTVSPGPWVLTRARDPELLALLASSQALYTRLDGEWWTGHLQWRRGPSGEDHRAVPDGRPVPVNDPQGSGTCA